MNNLTGYCFCGQDLYYMTAEQIKQHFQNHNTKHVEFNFSLKYPKQIMIYNIHLIDNNQMECVKCHQTVIGDPKYHEVYEKGLIVGYRHRRCI